ncbi:MAG TPA: hypothetical protein PLU54_07425 [Deltaproteobacteria bacterium]|nr:hypothetical protein [Deltaproteobacteria bacterium]
MGKRVQSTQQKNRGTVPPHSFPYWELAVFLVSGLIFTGIVLAAVVPEDILYHARYVMGMLNRTMPWPANPLYYLLVSGIALFQDGFVSLVASSVLVLSGAVAAKLFLARRISEAYLLARASGRGADAPSPDAVALVCIATLFAFSLPTPAAFKGLYYLGQLPPNVWHNPSTIALMPLALLLFHVSHLQLERPVTSRAATLTFLAALNILMKPSFFFVFAVAYPLMLLRRFRLARDFWINLLPVAAGLGMLAVVYHLIYVLGFSNMWKGQSGVAFGLFTVWSLWSPNVGLSLVASVLFPAAFLCLHPAEFGRDTLLQYAALSFAVAVIIFSVLMETGPRMSDGNFVWQCMVCNYLLFLVVSLAFYDKVRTEGMAGWRNRTLAVCWTLHVISGIAYIVKFFSTGRFY